MGRNTNIVPVPYYQELVQKLLDAFLLIKMFGIEDDVVSDLESFLNEYWPELLLEF